MVSDWDYREGERQGAAGGAKGDKKSGKVGVRYFDARDGRTREVKVDVESTDKRHPFTQPDQAPQNTVQSRRLNVCRKPDAR